MFAFVTVALGGSCTQGDSGSTERCLRENCVAQRTNIDACIKALPVCVEIRPAFNGSSCCGLTCRKAEVPESCGSDDAKQRCASGYSALPACGSGKKPEMNRTSCCPSCRPVPPGQYRRPDNAPCAPDKMKECLDQLDDCEDGQVPVFDDSSCCGSCRRPSRSCSPADVADCAKDVPECEPLTKPKPVTGRCCLSCRPPPPVCSPVCANSSVCLRAGKSAVGQCRRARYLRYKLSGLGATIRGLMANGSAALVIGEIIQRYCDQAQYQRQCAAFADALESLTAKFTPDPAASDAGTLEIGVRSDSSSRQTDTTGAVVDGALTSQDATGGQITARSETSNAVAAGVSALLAVAAAVAVGVVAVAM